MAGARRPRPHSHAPRALEEVAAIRSHGRRLTRQRALIWDALLHAGGRHLSARDVAESVHGAAPELHQATIYRALDVFVADGLVRRTDFGDGRAVYEIAAEHRHHHVVCRSCGAVAHVHDDALRGAFDQVEAESGFRLADAELTFYGTCASCAAAYSP
jgi:Fur family transcriptional regulator, ferric uptake regulator